MGSGMPDNGISCERGKQASKEASQQASCSCQAAAFARVPLEYYVAELRTAMSGLSGPSPNLTGRLTVTSGAGLRCPALPCS